MEVRENYESPAVFVVEMDTEGVICESGQRSPYGDAFEF